MACVNRNGLRKRMAKVRTKNSFRKSKTCGKLEAGGQPRNF